MDNKYWNLGCPALMSDGRFITNHVSCKNINQQIKDLNKITNAYEYKDYLQKNTETIIQKRNKYYEDNFSCNLNGKCVPVAKDTGACSVCDVN